MCIRDSTYTNNHGAHTPRDALPSHTARDSGDTPSPFRHQGHGHQLVQSVRCSSYSQYTRAEGPQDPRDSPSWILIATSGHQSKLDQGPVCCVSEGLRVPAYAPTRSQAQVSCGECRPMQPRSVQCNGAAVGDQDSVNVTPSLNIQGYSSRGHDQRR